MNTKKICTINKVFFYKIFITLSILIATMSANVFANESCTCKNISSLSVFFQEDLKNKKIWKEFKNNLLKGIKKKFSLSSIIKKDLDKIHSEIKQFYSKEPEIRPAFIFCTIDEYKHLKRKKLIKNGNFEVINSRLFSLPLYVFKKKEKKGQVTKKNNQIEDKLYYCTPRNLKINQYYIKQQLASLLNLKPLSNVEWTTNSTTLAGSIFYKNDRYNHIVAIYDEEPSTLVSEFIRSYVNICDSEDTEDTIEKDCSPPFYPIDLSDDAYSAYRLRIKKDGINYIILKYQEQDFYNFFLPENISSPGVIGISREGIQEGLGQLDSYPLILTNLRGYLREVNQNKCCMEKFWEILGNAYLGILPFLQKKTKSEDDNIITSGKDWLYYSCLLNANLLKIEDPLNKILFYSYLENFYKEKADTFILEDFYRENENIFVRIDNPKIGVTNKERKKQVNELKLERVKDWRNGIHASFGIENVVEKIRKKDKKFNGLWVRQKFSGSIIRAYKSAKEKIKLEKLEDALAWLYPALNDEQIYEERPDRGLWTVGEYDPFWQLARIKLKNEFEIDTGENR